MRTYNDIYIEARNALRVTGAEGYSLDAKLLVASAAGKTLAQLMRDLPLYATPEIERRVKEYIERRLKGEPVAYITGTWQFYGLELKVTPDVLIPRMDTELLIDTAKELLIGHNMNADILDLCCGSGCISCAVAHELPATKITAIDISALALQVARENVDKLGYSSRIYLKQADVCTAPPYGTPKYDMIISNPPYIAHDEIMLLDPSVRDHEPIWALDGGDDGLKFYKAIIKFWKDRINNGGALLFEVGEGQAEAVCEMLLYSGFASATTRKDTLGVERVVVGIMA